MRVKGPEVDLSRITLPMYFAFFAGVLGTFALMWHCYKSDAPYINLLAGAGALSGWAIGMLAAPLSTHEEKRFGEFAKILSGVLTGYLLSKFDPIVTELVEVREGAEVARIMGPPYAEQALVTVCAFGIALLFVFSARLYWSGGPAEAALAEWIDSQPDPKPSRSEAIHRLAGYRPHLSNVDEAAITAWIDGQPDPKPSRAEAIRRLIERGLRGI